MQTDWKRGYAQADSDLRHGILGFAYPAVSPTWRCGYIARLLERERFEGRQ
jgi:hypothetical protein